jgi:hypothetical protein
MRKIQVFFASLFYRIFNPALADLIVAIKKSDSDGVEGLCRRITSYTGDQTNEITKALRDVTQGDMKDRINSILVKYKFLGPIGATEGATETDKTSTATPPGLPSSQAVAVVPGRAQQVSPPQPPTLVELAQQGNVRELRATLKGATPSERQNAFPHIINFAFQDRSRRMLDLVLEFELSERDASHIFKKACENRDVKIAALVFDKISSQRYADLVPSLEKILSAAVQDMEHKDFVLKILNMLKVVEGESSSGELLSKEVRVAINGALQNHNDGFQQMLFIAIAEDKSAVVNTLITFGVSPNQLFQGKTAMVVAVEHGRSDLLEFMHLVGGGDIKFKMPTGDTLLHLSLQTDQYRVAQYLLSIEGSTDDINHMNNESKTPLDCLGSSTLPLAQEVRKSMKGKGAKTAEQIQRDQAIQNGIQSVRQLFSRKAPQPPAPQRGLLKLDE